MGNVDLRMVDCSQQTVRSRWLLLDTERRDAGGEKIQRAMTVIFFEYTGGLCGTCMSSPISNCKVCLPGGS